MSQTGYIQVTRECNQDCRFCSNPPFEKIIDLDEGIRMIEHYRAEGYERIIFTGGEPTMSPVLPDLIRYASGAELEFRMITNGQKIADPKVFENLYQAGLRNLNISLYSVLADVQSFLTSNPDSLENVKKAIANLAGYPDVNLVINTVINKYNADHLSRNIEWLLAEAPFVRHFVWNNLDPRNNKASQYRDTIARLNDFELELHKALRLVTQSGRTCRVERVPLCYLPEFEYVATEARKIVKKDRTATYFLDDKGLIMQDVFEYGRGEACGHCRLCGVCPGLFEMDVYYFSEELYPVFIDPAQVAARILQTR